MEHMEQGMTGVGWKDKYVAHIKLQKLTLF